MKWQTKQRLILPFTTVVSVSVPKLFKGVEILKGAQICKPGFLTNKIDWYIDWLTFIIYHSCGNLLILQSAEREAEAKYKKLAQGDTEQMKVKLETEKQQLQGHVSDRDGTIKALSEELNTLKSELLVGLHKMDIMSLKIC